MSDKSLNILIKYILKTIPCPGSHIGIMLAQELMQHITQSSLSGKFFSSSKYITINDLLNLRSCNAKCYILEQDNVIHLLDKVTILDIIDHISSDGYNIKFVLSKTKMRERSVIFSEVINVIECNIDYGSNSDPWIYVMNGSNTESLEIITYIESLTIRGIINVIKDGAGRYYCDISYAKLLSSKNIIIECTDIKTVYELFGIESAKNLIYKTLIYNSVRPYCAEFVSMYMTMSGKVLPFDREIISGKFGPLFDMYFSKPKDALVKWILSGNIDYINNPYTNVMTGCF